MKKTRRKRKLKRSFLDTEFRVIADGESAVFIPTDAEGKKRDAVSIRIGVGNPNAVKVALGWQPNDRVFLRRDDTKEPFENCFLNERTKEKIRL